MDNFSQLAEIEQLILQMNQKPIQGNQINPQPEANPQTNRIYLG